MPTTERPAPAGPAVEVVRDAQQTTDAVEHTLGDLPPAAWDGSSPTSRDVVEDARAAALWRWHEAVMHHDDLGCGEPPVLTPW